MASKFGRRPRFDLPWKDYRTIYAVEFTNGIVKVGCTGSMNSRFTALAAEARRKHGGDMARLHYGVNIPGRRGHLIAEKELLRRMNRIARARVGHFEYFEHVAFGVAMNLVDQVSAGRVLSDDNTLRMSKRKSREAA